MPQFFMLAVQEIISIAADKLPNYEAKIKSFYEEHIHSDDEIRFILDGKGEWTEFSHGTWQHQSTGSPICSPGWQLQFCVCCTR